MDCLSRFVACLRPSNPNCVVPQFCQRFAVCFHDSVGFVREYYPSSRLEDLCAEFFPLHLHHAAIEPKDSAPLLSSSVYIEWHSECWVADLRFSALDGRWPAHEITENLCAPFIHSFIVDEWETTNHKPREGPTGQVARSFRQTELCPVHRVLCDERAWQPITGRGTFEGGRTFVLPHPSCKRRSLDGAQSIEGGPEVKNLTGPPALTKLGRGTPFLAGRRSRNATAGSSTPSA